MKKMLITAAVMSVCFAVAAIALWDKGFGKVQEVTASPVLIDGFTANTVSVYCAGSNVVFTLVNSTTNELATRIASNTAIPIPPYGTYTFDNQAHGHVYNVVLATTNGTAAAYIAGY